MSDPIFESTTIRLLRRNVLPYLFPALLALAGCIVVRIYTPDAPLLASALHGVGPPPPPPLLIPGEPPILHQAEIFSRTVWDVWKQGQDMVPEQRRIARWLPYEIVGIVAVLVAISIFQVNPFAVRRRGVLRIEEDGRAKWNKRRLFVRDEIEQGLLRPGPRAVGVIVRLEKKGWLPRVVELLCDDVGEARRILWSLRLDAAQCAASFRISSLANTHAMLGPIVTTLRVAMILVVGALAISLGHYGFRLKMAWIGGILGVLLLLLFVLRSWPVRVTVGTDGVLVRWIVVQRWVPFPVRDVVSFDFGVRLVRHEGEGEPVELAVVSVPWYVPRRLLRVVHWVPLWLSVQRDLLLSRIDQAMSARAAHRPPEVPSRAPGEAAAWSRQQRSETTEQRAMSSDLVEVVEDPWAPASLRASSSMELWGRAPPSDPTHLRALAAATANPPLRALFDALAKGDRRHAREALRALEVVPARE